MKKMKKLKDVQRHAVPDLNGIFQRLLTFPLSLTALS